MKKILLLLFFIITLIPFFLKNTYSVDPEEFLQNPKLELRARKISKNVRCLVCQNQSIDESSAFLAKDLRIIIREKITQGQTDDEIYSFLKKRYGDFILLKPPLNMANLVLWVLPFLLFALGIYVIFLRNKKSKNF